MPILSKESHFASRSEITISSGMRWTSFENKKCNNIAQLTQKIKEFIKEIPLKMIQDSVDIFRSRVHACEKNSGGLILNKYY